jgi:hypothetical protein
VATPQADILEAATLPAGTRAGAARVGGISAGCTLVLEIDLRGEREDLAWRPLRMPRALCRQNS